MLVNNQHPLPTSFQPHTLEVWTHEQAEHVQQQQTIQLEKSSLQHLSALMKESAADGEIIVVSGYRSVEEQQQIYEQSLLDNGADFTARFVARPHESEHQTGLAVDVGQYKEQVDLLCPSFPDEAACLRFKQLAASYGFIQRYKEEKKSLTGIDCEPWHFRYVGYPHAIIMEQRGLCLEEYITMLRLYSPFTPLVFPTETAPIMIYFVAAKEGESTLLPVDLNSYYQLSGNNVDGFIVTVFPAGRLS